MYCTRDMETRMENIYRTIGLWLPVAILPVAQYVV